MKLMEEIFFSFTFGGETLSLAAAKAVLHKLQREPVLETIKEVGQYLLDGLGVLLNDAKAGHIFNARGHPSWSFLTISDQPNATSLEIRTLLLQELHQNGILSLGSHNLSYAHGASEIDVLLDTYRAVLPMIGEAVDSGDITARLRCDPLAPLFKVR